MFSKKKTYNLTIDHQMPAEGNESFAQATPLVVDDADTCQTDHIGSIGDLDYFRFDTPGSGDHLLVVKAAESQKNTPQAPYTVSVEVMDIDDPPEVQTDGNNTLETADTLTSGVAANGKIAFRGDEDWYRIDIDTSTPKVLELFLDTAAAGRVEYYLSLMRDGVIKKTHDADGSDDATELKTSVGIPQSTSAPHTATYLIKISDYQNDEGDDEIYTLQANILSVPANVPNGPATSPVYFDEISEGNGPNAVEVELETTSLVQASFGADTALLDYRNGGVGIAQTANPDGTTTISFPWIAGYIDYQGDQDWFQIAMQTLDPNNPDD